MHEVRIEIINNEYVDPLITALVRQGFIVYLDEDNNVCFQVHDIDLTKITMEKKYGGQV